MLKGMEIKVLKTFADERGFFTEIMRRDWEDISEEEIVQANFSISYPGMVRAWHRHLRGQVDCFVVAYLVYFVNRLYDYENPDEDRRRWNDPTIVPKIINGRTDDARCKKPWDWFYSPYT